MQNKYSEAATNYEVALKLAIEFQDKQEETRLAKEIIYIYEIYLKQPEKAAALKQKYDLK
jgi:hypothetical protein